MTSDIEEIETKCQERSNCECGHQERLLKCDGNALRRVVLQ